MAYRKCSVVECDKNAHWTAKGARGWCNSHWYKWKTHGSPTGGRQTKTGAPKEYINTIITAEPTQSCLMWPFARNSAGYGHLVVGGRHVLAHRMICEAANGAPTAVGLRALHKCGNGHLGCCNPIHIRWGTDADNSADAKMHGTLAAGEKHGGARLSADDVHEIRKQKGAVLQRVLAERFGVTQPNISAIQRGVSWRSVG